MGMTICLAPRGACGGGVLRSRFTCRVFGRASILASPSVVRRRMTKMPPDGYPALQYLQSGRVRKIQGLAKTIRQLLGGAKFAIDYYQREYRWQNKQVQELIDDLTDKF